VFAGGDKEIYDQCYPLFEAVGNPEKIDLFGPVGMGQVAKDVQQMTERMPTLARLELLAFGIRAGLTREQLLKALDAEPGSPNPYVDLLSLIDADDKHRLSPMAAEWKYYLAEAKSIGMRMPMLEGVYEMLKDAPKTAEDNVHRPIACFWDEMMKARVK
jgi:3-hydroxyisobutyrate dehydrogenase-like beta-hydroxyacid dehydrogenase